jgi:hypothetical protein
MINIHEIVEDLRRNVAVILARLNELEAKEQMPPTSSPSQFANRMKKIFAQCDGTDREQAAICIAEEADKQVAALQGVDAPRFDQPFSKTEDNSLVYNLKQERAHNGKPIMVNDIAVSLSLIRDPDAREKVAGIILSALNAHITRPG